MSFLDTVQMSRRRLLDYLTRGLGAVIAAALAGPLLGYTASPALEQEEVTWRELCLAGDIPVGKPTRVKYAYAKKEGWYEHQVEATAWVATRDGSTFTVFHPACTHLGCGYHWEEDKQQFLCPCHTGVFDLDGKVVAGPPPRPLDRFENKVEDGKIFIGQLLVKEG